MDNEFSSFKSLEEVYLKTTYNTTVNGRNFEEGEIIASFDKISMAVFNENKEYVAAHGGFDNRPQVFWETTKELQLNFSQGVFSKTQFSLFTNANIIQYTEQEPILITYREELESNEDGYIQTTYLPVYQTFVYNKETGEKLTWSRIGDRLKITNGYTDVVVTYCYNYNGGAQEANIGQQYLNGFLELQGKTRVKDDTSGLITTGIIKIPKLKLMSGLSIRLGTQANPVVGNFSAIAVPVGSRRSSYVAQIDFLNNDIDSDM